MQTKADSRPKRDRGPEATRGSRSRPDDVAAPPRAVRRAAKLRRWETLEVEPEWLEAPKEAPASAAASSAHRRALPVPAAPARPGPPRPRRHDPLPAPPRPRAVPPPLAGASARAATLEVRDEWLVEIVASCAPTDVCADDPVVAPPPLPASDARVGVPGGQGARAPRR